MDATVLYLQLPESRQEVSLPELIGFGEEFLPIDGGHCEHCRADVRRVQKTTIDHVRAIAVFDINRIREVARGAATAGRVQKDRCSVKLLHQVELAGRNLRLQELLCHQSDTYNAGHYVTFARHESTWICYNDSDEPKD